MPRGRERERERRPGTPEVVRPTTRKPEPLYAGYWLWRRYKIQSRHRVAPSTLTTAPPLSISMLIRWLAMFQPRSLSSSLSLSLSLSRRHDSISWLSAASWWDPATLNRNHKPKLTLILIRRRHDAPPALHIFSINLALSLSGRRVGRRFNFRGISSPPPLSLLFPPSSSPRAFIFKESSDRLPENFNRVWETKKGKLNG